MSARYVVGIDLGTTHSALSFADANAEDGESRQRRGKDAPPASALHKPPVGDQCCCNRLLNDVLPESLGNSAECKLELMLNGGE